MRRCFRRLLLRIYIFIIHVHTWIIVAGVIPPVNLSPICTQCARAAFTPERKIIQWLRLTWDLRELGLILPSATAFILIHMIYLCPYVPWKGHRGHCLNWPSKADLNPHQSWILEGIHVQQRVLMSFDPHGTGTDLDTSLRPRKPHPAPPFCLVG